jgi:hypothetical protein
MKLQPIQDTDGFKKDVESGAVLAVDNRALQAYKMKRKQQNAVVDDINNIKQELQELKEMLKLVISSQKDN